MSNNKKTYWPHMILGFLMLGFTLSYWTVKSASSIPVQESNQFMMKYQEAELNINEIVQMQQDFNRQYTIALLNTKTKVIELENTKRAKTEKVVLLNKGKNTFTYSIHAKDNSMIKEAKVSFLLTRPHTRKDDIAVDTIEIVNNRYIIKDIVVTKPGRYILQIKVQIGDSMGYSEIPAYLNP